MKVALIHDWLTGMRGGEKCLEVFCELFPDATLFTLVHQKGSVSPVIESMEIKISVLQKFPFAARKYRSYLPLFPTIIEQFDLRGFDLILSSSHCAAKGIVPQPGALHICYCYTPMRYIWNLYHEYFSRDRLNWFSKWLIPCFANYLRTWDVASSSRVDEFIAISENVRERIRRYYQRDSRVIYPPVDVKNTYLAKEGNYFLIVSAFAPYKRIDLAIQAFNELGERLIIVGSGQDDKRLKKMAGRNIEFTGWINEQQLQEYYAGCRALIFPGEEDFGIVPVEAQCYGKPVIAYAKGGVLESVKGKWIEDEREKSSSQYTGIFFSSQTPAQLQSAVRQLDEIDFDPQLIRDHALKFDRELFKMNIKQFIDRRLAENNKSL